MGSENGIRKNNDFSKKLVNPDEFYSKPNDVLNDALLALNEKRRVLENWRDRGLTPQDSESTSSRRSAQIDDDFAAALQSLSDAPEE